jgi:aminoglycoside phosphotransferase (APT) family kinase protein
MLLYTEKMHEKYLGDNMELANRIAQKAFPQATSFRAIDDGQENLVIVIDESQIIRFPRSEEIWSRSMTERRILQKLSSSDMPIPKLIRISEDPAYIIVAYLRGRQILSKELRALPTSALEQIGSNIATFAFEFHEQLTLEEFEPLIQPPTWSYDEYLKRVLLDKTNENPRIDALCKEYYHKWLEKPAGGKKVVVHDDLHLGNLLFDKEYHLSGVLDFGAVCIGTAEQELRQTYRLGEVGFEAAASTYEQLSKKPFDREAAKLWTVTQELATYCREDSELVHERARENLNFWFPGTFET